MRRAADHNAETRDRRRIFQGAAEKRQSLQLIAARECFIARAAWAVATGGGRSVGHSGGSAHGSDTARAGGHGSHGRAVSRQPTTLERCAAARTAHGWCTRLAIRAAARGQAAAFLGGRDRSMGSAGVCQFRQGSSNCPHQTPVLSLHSAPPPAR